MRRWYLVGCERTGYCGEMEVASVLEALGDFWRESGASELVGAREGGLIV